MGCNWRGQLNAESFTAGPFPNLGREWGAKILPRGSNGARLWDTGPSLPNALAAFENPSRNLIHLEPRAFQAFPDFDQGAKGHLFIDLQF